MSPTYRAHLSRSDPYVVHMESGVMHSWKLLLIALLRSSNIPLLGVVLQVEAVTSKREYMSSFKLTCAFAPHTYDVPPYTS
jgi:hypothetical protein